MINRTYSPFPSTVPGPRPERLHLVDVWDAPEEEFATEPPHVAPSDIPAELRRLAKALEAAPVSVRPEGVPLFVASELRRLADRVHAPEGGA